MDKRLNIVFIPPQNISNNAINLSHQINKDSEVSFILNTKTHFPHITIYQLIIPEKNLDKLLKDLFKICLKSKPQKFKFTKFQNNSGFLGASFNPSEEIKALQEEIVKGADSLREGRDLLKMTDPYALGKPESQRQIIKKYGFDNLFKFYDPHITLTHLPDVKAADRLTKSLKWEMPDFVSSSIGLYQLGDYGTCQKLIKRFDLKEAD